MDGVFDILFEKLFKVKYLKQLIMKKVMLTLVALLGLAMAKAESPVTVGVDFYNRYVWRGSDYGNSPSIQPTLKYTKGGFSAGVWGSYATLGTWKEADLFVTYVFPFGLTLGAQDFFMPNGVSGASVDYFYYAKDSTSHAYEVNAAYTLKGLTLTGSYVITEAKTGGAGAQGGDTYFEAKYTLENGVNFFAGAGNGWYTYDYVNGKDNGFKFCNVGIGATKTIKITDSFSIPVNGSLIVNPDKKDIHFVIGFSL